MKTTTKNENVKKKFLFLKTIVLQNDLIFKASRCVNEGTSLKMRDKYLQKRRGAVDGESPMIDFHSADF